MSDKNSTQGTAPLPPEGTSKAKPTTEAGKANGAKAKPANGAKTKPAGAKAKPTPAGAKTPGAKATPPPAGTEATPEAEASTPGEAEPTAAAPETASSAPEAAPLPDLEAHAEAPAWLSGGGDHDSRIWDGAFEAEAGASEPAAEQGADAGAEEADAEGIAAEPEVTNPDDVTLETPSLGDADISSDAAEAASLGDATAEVKEVEAQAADAAVLTDPAANHPAAVNRTEGIAAAAPMTGISPSTAEPEPTGAADAKDKEDTADAKGIESSGKPDNASPVSDAGDESKADGDAATSATPEAAAAAEPAESRRSRRESEPPSSGNNGRNKRLLLIAGIIGVLAVLVVLLFTVILGSEKEPGVLEENVAPIELESGACLSGFTGVNDPTNVVTCDTPHNAQLVATATYDEDDEFPGSDALTERADEVCAGVRYTESAAENSDLDLQVNKAVPTPASWEDGDRRVDCFVVAGEGRELTESLIEQ